MADGCVVENVRCSPSSIDIIMASGQSTGAIRIYDSNNNLIQQFPVTVVTGNVTLTPNSNTRNLVVPTGDFKALVLKGTSPRVQPVLEVQDDAGAVVMQVFGKDGISSDCVVVRANRPFDTPLHVIGATNGLGQPSLFIEGPRNAAGQQIGYLEAMDETGLFLWHLGLSVAPGVAHAAQIQPGFTTNVSGSQKGFLSLAAFDSAFVAREFIRGGANGTVAQIGFYGTTPVSRPSSYTTIAGVSRTVPADPSTGYTGIDNLQAGTVYGKVADLEALRVVVSALDKVVSQLIKDLGSAAGNGLLANT